MTDNEIIKALECCSIDSHIGVCKECPFTDVCDEDEQALQKHALDLINRQKAEIERLLPFGCQVEVSKKIEAEIKTEAIKEFAEKLCEDRVSNDPVVIAVKTELKMTEVNK